MNLKICVPEESERRFLYTVDEKQIAEACVGYLRMDFDSSGNGFHHTWFGQNDTLNDRRFIKEFDEVIDTLRHDLLSGRSGMEKYNHAHEGLEIVNWGIHGKGYRVETEQNVYYLRCMPQRGDYDCYCYCYDRAMLEQALAAEQEPEETPEMGGLLQ